MEPIYRIPPWRQRTTILTLDERLDWSLEMIGAPEAWKRTRGAWKDPDTGETKKVRILIIDTGVQVGPDGRCNHPDLSGNLASGIDFTGSPFGIGDHQGHGTATTSLIGAKNDGAGIIGVASEAKIDHAKALGDDGTGENRWIARAVDYGHDIDADIISFSGGSAVDDPVLRDAIERFVAHRAQRFFIAAAGNDGLPNSVNFPAAYPFVLAVGAVDRNKVTALFSSRGDQVDIAGPGVGVKCAAIGSRWGAFDGTSFACPIVAGTAALLLAKHRGKKTHNTPLNTIEDLIGHLKASAIKTDDPTGTGWGIVNAGDMLARDDEPEAPKTPIVERRVGPFVFHMPARPGDFASVGLGITTNAEKSAAVGVLSEIAAFVDSIDLQPVSPAEPKAG